MSGRNREISIFNISALDLFAAALGAFILIVLILFPYYNKGGTDQMTVEQLEEQIRQRRVTADQTQSEMAKVRLLEAELALLNKKFLTEKENLSEMESRIAELIEEAAQIEIPDPPPIPKPEPTQPPPRNVARGVEFSILGLATEKKRFVIVVDMSGSMVSYTDIVTTAVKEIITQMKPDSEFAILGYRGTNGFVTHPSTGGLTRATPQAVSGALSFVNQLPRQFSGGTPTQGALVRALNMNPEALILLSDGEPDDATPANIIQAISQRNQTTARAEIHTVAIGDYTKDPKLTLFLQELARRNRGDFVGISK